MTSTDELPVNAYIIGLRYGDWQIGQMAKVKFGRHGTQRARCVGYTRDGLVKAEKYRRNSGRWTAPVVVYPSEVICFYPFKR